MSDPQQSHVPVWKTVTATYGTGFGTHPAQLLKRLWLPLALSLGILALEIAARNNGGSLTRWQAWAVAFLPGFVDVIPYTVFAVAWHRLLLLEAEARGRPTSWRREHSSFIVCALVLFVVLNVTQMGLAYLWHDVAASAMTSTADDENTAMVWAVLPLLSLVCCLALLYLWARTCLVFPVAALGSAMSPRTSWRRTRGHGVNIAVVCIMVNLPLFVLGYLIQTRLFVFLYGLLTADGGVDIVVASNRVSYVIDGLLVLVDYAIVLANVTLVSLCYRRLVLDEAA